MRIVNDTSDPQAVGTHEHFCQARRTSAISDPDESFAAAGCESLIYNDTTRVLQTLVIHSDQVSVDPDTVLPATSRVEFRKLLQDFNQVFSPNFKGYNGAVGPFYASVNMGPVQLPRRKGRIPQYARDKLVVLQSCFNELEQLGVSKKPEYVGINVKYVNQSFLVKKLSRGHRFVTAFTDVGRYSKPQPSLMPDVNST